MKQLFIIKGFNGRTTSAYLPTNKHGMLTIKAFAEARLKLGSGIDKCANVQSRIEMGRLHDTLLAIFP
jgi:hypothetical protein